MAILTCQKDVSEFAQRSGSDYFLVATASLLDKISSNSKADLDDGWMLSLSVECEVVDQVLTVHDVLDGGAIASWMTTDPKSSSSQRFRVG